MYLVYFAWFFFFDSWTTMKFPYKVFHEKGFKSFSHLKFILYFTAIEGSSPQKPIQEIHNNIEYSSLN